MSFSDILLEGVKGVGTIQLTLNAEKNVHTFIGENGIGKTKLLESLCQLLLGSHQLTKSLNVMPFQSELLVLSHAKIDNAHFSLPKKNFQVRLMLEGAGNTDIKIHNMPLVYMASQNRGFMTHQQKAILPIGTFADRKHKYIHSLFHGMQTNFANLNMDNDIEHWFISRAQSSNSYQKQADNRIIELQTVLKLLHQLDQRIDAEFLEISGDNRVFLKINQEKRQLSQLSTGFASILKIMQSIISAYGNFTNETNLQQINGIILIDEIESHLHLSWQAKIIPLLKNLFPNSQFYITTHSSIVLSQLEAGEAYKLQRNDDGVVRSQAITAPAKMAFVDVLKQAFDIDLNKMKHQRMSAKQQKEVKNTLFKLLEESD
jgi:predicted ATP-binding protein involved in virulence